MFKRVFEERMDRRGAFTTAGVSACISGLEQGGVFVRKSVTSRRMKRRWGMSINRVRCSPSRRSFILWIGYFPLMSL
jgi:hypothetical protein